MKHKIKIETGSGYYLIDNWDDILSLRVCVSEKRSRDLYFHFKCRSLEDKLEDMCWIDDKEHKIDDVTCITRRWAKVGSFIFIPRERHENL